MHQAVSIDEADRSFSGEHTPEGHGSSSNDGSSRSSSDHSPRPDMISIVISNYTDPAVTCHDGFIQEVEVSLEEIEELVGELEEEILKRDTRLASLDQAADSPGSSSSLVGRIGRRIDLCLNEVGQMKTLLAERKEEIAQLTTVLSDKDSQLREMDADRCALLDKAHGLQLQVAAFSRLGGADGEGVVAEMREKDQRIRMLEREISRRSADGTGEDTEGKEELLEKVRLKKG